MRRRTDTEYFASRALSKSGIDRLLECPAIYKAWLDEDAGRKTTEALIFGGMSHKVLLEPETFAEEYAVTGLDLTTKAGREWKESLEDGITIIKEQDYERALLMAEAVRDHPQAKHLFCNYVAERPIYWTREDGIECKAKPDILSNVSGLRFVADYKTTGSANPEAIRRCIHKYGYHRQAAWYLDGLEAVGQPCMAFIFIFVEKQYPHLVTVCRLDEHALNKGREDCARAVEILKECRASGLYPCYTRDILTIGLPEWAA